MASSTTHRLQVPFGALPLKVDRAVAPLGVGAGAGIASLDSSSRLVGRKVPLMIGLGTGPSAVSAKVRFVGHRTVRRVRHQAGVAEQEQVLGLCRTGQQHVEVDRRLMGDALQLAVTWVISPASPVTKMLDG